MFHARQDLAFGGTIGSEFIGHDHPGHIAQTLQQLAKEALGRLRVAAALDQHIEHVPMLINGPPKIMQFAPDADKHLVQKPFVAGLRPPPLERLGIGSPEAQAPLADGLVADHDASRCEDQLDFTQTQAEAVIQPDRLVDDSAGKRKPRYGLDVVLMPMTLPQTPDLANLTVPSKAA